MNLTKLNFERDLERKKKKKSEQKNETKKKKRKKEKNQDIIFLFPQIKPQDLYHEAQLQPIIIIFWVFLGIFKYFLSIFLSIF